MLRGLANGGLPASTRDALSSAKRSDGEEDLAADLDERGTAMPAARVEPVGDPVDGAHVERDVLARAPVAAGGARTSRPFS